jgi:hypothetical protein
VVSSPSEDSHASGASSRAVKKVRVGFMFMALLFYVVYFPSFASASISLILKRTLMMEVPTSSLR